MSCEESEGWAFQAERTASAKVLRQDVLRARRRPVWLERYE